MCACGTGNTIDWFIFAADVWTRVSASHLSGTEVGLIFFPTRALGFTADRLQLEQLSNPWRSPFIRRRREKQHRASGFCWPAVGRRKKETEAEDYKKERKKRWKTSLRLIDSASSWYLDHITGEKKKPSASVCELVRVFSRQCCFFLFCFYLPFFFIKTLFQIL